VQELERRKRAAVTITLREGPLGLTFRSTRVRDEPKAEAAIAAAATAAAAAPEGGKGARDPDPDAGTSAVVHALDGQAAAAAAAAAEAAEVVGAAAEAAGAVSEGERASPGLRAGMVLLSINGRRVDELSFIQTHGLLAAAERPVALSFYMPPQPHQ
jgi:hypothetical protein